MKAILISIGDELVLGQTLDTNAAWLSERLAGLGIPVVEHVTVGDDYERLAATLQRCGQDGEIIIVTGGIGPTEDDLTRQVVAKILDKPLVLDEASLKHIQELFHQRNMEMPERNRIQAMIPEGSNVIANPTGTAAGLMAHIGHSQCFVLPGVPSEMKVMYNESVEPVIATERENNIIVSRRLHLIGMSESELAEKLGDIMSRDRNPLVNCAVAKGIITLRIIASAKNGHDAKLMIKPIEKKLRDILGTNIYGSDEQTLADVVVQLLVERKQTLSVVESCTGGWLAKTITDVPGVSEVFNQGWITYSNQAKHQQLQVPNELLESYGAVNHDVCEAMAENARQISQSDIALAITGIAGPGGGSESKPVGLVYIGLSNSKSTEVKRFCFNGSRDSVRWRAVNRALDLLRNRLL
jgi:nicotinamide-nucleotide amidase